MITNIALFMECKDSDMRMREGLICKKSLGDVAIQEPFCSTNGIYSYEFLRNYIEMQVNDLLAIALTTE